MAGSGTTVAVTRKLIEQGRIRPEDVTVIAITGNGLKTIEAIHLAAPPVIAPRLKELEALLNGTRTQAQEGIAL